MAAALFLAGTKYSRCRCETADDNEAFECLLDTEVRHACKISGFPLSTSIKEYEAGGLFKRRGTEQIMAKYELITRLVA